MTSPRESEQEFKMCIEKTSLRNNKDDTSFFFRVLNASRKVLHQSRRTIIQQPCWRDDIVSLQLNEDYTIEVYTSPQVTSSFSVTSIDEK